MIIIINRSFHRILRILLVYGILHGFVTRIDNMFTRRLASLYLQVHMVVSKMAFPEKHCTLLCYRYGITAPSSSRPTNCRVSVGVVFFFVSVKCYFVFLNEKKINKKKMILANKFKITY